jgi:hypothetical protein
MITSDGSGMQADSTAIRPATPMQPAAEMTPTIQAAVLSSTAGAPPC